MISKLNAVVVEVTDLAAAMHDYEALTGVAGVLGPFRGDDSACFQLTNMRLRLVTTGGRQGLKQMAFQSDDLAAARAALAVYAQDAIGFSERRPGGCKGTTQKYGYLGDRRRVRRRFFESLVGYHSRYQLSSDNGYGQHGIERSYNTPNCWA